MIIDGETVIAGSFNFTKQAEEKNDENLLIVKDKEIAEKYPKNWQEDLNTPNCTSGTFPNPREQNCLQPFWVRHQFIP